MFELLYNWFSNYEKNQSIWNVWLISVSKLSLSYLHPVSSCEFIGTCRKRIVVSVCVCVCVCCISFRLTYSSCVFWLTFLITWRAWIGLLSLQGRHFLKGIFFASYLLITEKPSHAKAGNFSSLFCCLFSLLPEFHSLPLLSHLDLKIIYIQPLH